MLDASSKAGKQSFKTIIALYARVFDVCEMDGLKYDLVTILLYLSE